MDELNKLYEAVSSKFDVGSYDDFSAKMGDTESRKRFYDTVSEKGFDLGEYDAYEQRLSGQVPKGVKAEGSGELESPSADSADSSLESNPTNNFGFSQPNEEFYANVKNSLGKYKTIRDGSGNVMGYDPNKQTPTFNPVTGKVTLQQTPAQKVRETILDEVKKKANIPEGVVSTLEKGNKIKYLKEVSNYLHLMGGEFEGKTAEEVLDNMGIDFDANAESFKKDVDEAIKTMPYYEHEGKELNSRVSADKDFIDIFPTEPELEEVTDATSLTKIYGDVDKYGYNVDDFNMYLESNNPRIKALVDKGIVGEGASDLTTQMEMFKNLRLYTVDRLKYINQYKEGLEYRKSNGEDVSEEMKKADSEYQQLTEGFANYTKDNLDAFTTFMDNQTTKQARKYEEYKNGEGNLVEDTLENMSQGFFGGVQDLVVFLADGLGADEFAEEARITKSIQDIGEADPLLEMWGRGKTTEYKGTKYMVTDEGQIIDLDTKKNVTSIADKIGLNVKELKERAQSGLTETYFSPYNTTVQSGGVMGNLAVQLIGTKGLGGVLGTSQKAQVASTMIMTSSMVYASTYEEVLQNLRDAGISEKEAREGANEVSMATATIAGLTSTFAYNPKAQSLLGGDRMKKLVASAVAANKEGGKKAMFNSIKDNTIKILYSGGKEGLEETVQENLEYLTQRLTSAQVNDRIGKDVLEEDIKAKDIIDNSILAFGSSSMVAGIGELNDIGYSPDKLETLELLSKDYDKVQKNMDRYVAEGAVSEADAKKLLGNVEKYMKYSNKMPDNIDKMDKLPLIDLLDKRGNLEQRKANEDKAFHPYIKEEIEKVDAQIATLLGKPVKEGVLPPTGKKINSRKGLQQTLAKGSWGMLTGENPNVTALTPKENRELNKKAKEWLKEKGYEPQAIKGYYGGNTENSFFVPDLTREDAIEFAKEFNQESVATNEGLMSQDGSYNPRIKGDSVGGQYEDNYSTISTPEGDISFKTNYDWDKTIEKMDKPKKFFTGRKTKIENFKETRGEFIFFSEKEEVANKYGVVTEASLNTNNFFDLSSQDKKSKLIDSMSDEELIKIFKIKQSERSRFPKSVSEEVKIFKDRVREGEQRFSGQGELQNTLLRYLKNKGYDGVILQDAQYGKLDNSYVVFNKNVINESNKKSTEASEAEGGQAIEEGADSSTVGDVEGTKPKAISEKAAKTADAIRKLKINSSTKDAMSKLNTRPTAVFEVAWDGAIETVATTVAVTGHLAQAVYDGVQVLKDSDWYRGLSPEGRAKAERMFREDLERQFGSTEEINNPSFNESVKASFNKLKEVTIQRFVDKFHILRKAVDKNFDTKDDSVNFSQAEINMHGKAANDLDKFEAETKTLINEIADKGLTVDNVSDYLYAKHAEERNKHIKENIDPENEFGSGMTTQEIDKILNNTFTEDQIKDLEALSKKFYKITQGTRDMMKDFGLISEEQYNSLQEYYENYVPLKGFENEAIEAVGNIQGSRLDVQGAQTKRAAGRSTRADNVIANIIAERVAVNMKARKNEVLQTLHKLAEENPDNEVMTLYTPETLPRKITVQQDGTKVKQPERPDAREDYVGVKVDGQQYYIKFANKELGRVLNAANVEKADIITKTLRSVNRYLSATLTSLNPEFVISNFARDIQTAVFNVTAESDINAALKGQNIAKSVVKDTGKAIKAIYANERKGKVDTEYQKYYDEFKEDGAKTGWANQNNLADIKKKMENIHKMRTKKSVKGGLKNMLEFVNDVNTAVENGVRLSAYANGRKAGMSRAQAAAMAKELTVNFNKSGEYGTVANSLYLFFNAAIQGNVRFIKAMTTLKKTVQPDGTVKKSLNRGQKLAMSMMAFASVVTMLNQAISDDDEDGQSFYSKIPDFEKERNLIIMNPANGKDYFKIPLPYGYNIFHNMGTVATEVSTGERGVGDGLGFMTSSAVGAFSPVSFGHSDNPAGVISSAVIPTIIKPLVDLQANEDYFGSQIYNENLPFGVPKPDSDMGRTSTPEAFKMTSKVLNEMTGGNDFESGALDFAPESLYYLFKFGIGGTGKFLMNTAETVDTAVDIASGQDKDLEARKIPFVRKVYAEPNDYVDQSNYFERFNKIQQRELAIKDRIFSKEATSKDKRERAKVSGTVKVYKETNKKLSEIRKRKRAAREIEDPILRTKKLRELDDLYFKLIKKANGIYNKKLGENYE